MKKTLLFLAFVIAFSTAHAQQTEYQKKIEQVEKQIDNYTKEHLASFEIPEKDLQQIQKSFSLEKKDGKPLDNYDLQKSLAIYKKYLLRVAFFNEYPAKRELYAPPPS